ncbi:MAG: hypothetical protein AAFZ15_10515 [Bacteroidota bacterium]
MNKTTFNKLLGIENSEYKFEAHNDFGFIHYLMGKEYILNNNYLILEEVWFWGFFNQRIEHKIYTKVFISS